MNITLEIVDQVRRYKSESQISMGAELSKLIITATTAERNAIEQFLDDLKGVTKAKTIEWLNRNPSNKEGILNVECIQ
jgi:valyl-tRNA synthetase